MSISNYFTIKRYFKNKKINLQQKKNAGPYVRNTILQCGLQRVNKIKFIKKIIQVVLVELGK